MKKWWILIAALLLGGGTYLAINWSKFFGASYPETIFPVDTFAYLSFHDIKEGKKNLNKTVFWQKTKTSPRKDTYQKQWDRVLNLFQSGTGIDAKPLLQQFSRDLTVGIFPLQQKNGGALVGYIDDENKTKEFFTTNVAASLKRRFPDSRRSEHNYNGAIYYKFSGSGFPENMQPAYCFLDHHLYLAMSENSLKRLLDVQSKKADPLKKNSGFQKVKQEVAYEKGLLFYLNVPALLKTVQGYGTPAMGTIWPSLLEIIGAKAIHSFAYRINVEKDGFAEAGFLFVEQQRTGLLKTYMNQSPRELQSLTSVPAASQFVTAGTLADFSKIWSEINQQLPNVLNADQLDKWNKIQQFMKLVLNFDVQKDLFAPLGNEFSFSYIPAPEREMNPGKMKYHASVQLKDSKKIQALLERVERMPYLQKLNKQQLVYNGKTIQSFQFKEGSLDINPCYYFDSNWFYFASGPDFMKQSIDAKLKGGGITSNSDFKKVTADFPKQVNGMTYTNVPAYLLMYSQILKKGDGETSWLRGFGLEEEFEYLAPFLSGAATYSVIRSDGMYFRSSASIPSIFLSFFPTLNSLPKYIDTVPR